MRQGCKVWALLLMPLGGGGVVVVEEEEDYNAFIVCPRGTCLLGWCIGILPSPICCYFSSLGPMDDGNVVDKEGCGGGPM